MSALVDIVVGFIAAMVSAALMHFGAVAPQPAPAKADVAKPVAAAEATQLSADGTETSTAEANPATTGTPLTNK